MQDKPNWELISHDYRLIPIKPTLDGEPCYEDHPLNPYSRQWLPEYGYFRDYDVRKQAYRAVFAGACGHTYGHHSVWQMYAPPYPAKTYPDRTWLEALDRPGARQMQFLKALIESRPYFTRIPDQNLLASDEGTGGNHVQATRAVDGSYALIHIPNANQTIEVNMGKLSGSTTAVWWYDPRDGTAHAAEAITTREIHSFTSPDDGQDWVLVLDDASRNFVAPGAKT